MSFERNVFVNCPFDDAYRPLLHSLLFTIYYLGFQPRIALESRDSDIPRIDRIVSLIRESKYAIHDLSRIQATAIGEFFRLNMPFELGVDFGCRLFKPGRCSRKRCLILGHDRYQHQAALSDIAGLDIQAHGGVETNLIREVRGWLAGCSRERAVGTTAIWDAFNIFLAEMRNTLAGDGHSREDIRHLGIDELMTCMAAWQIARPASSSHSRRTSARRMQRRTRRAGARESRRARAA